jgi:hypothetical protein
VRRSIDRDRSDAVLVACDPRAINDPTFIHSDLSRLALLLALSFDHKLDLLNHFLRLKPDLSPKLASTLKLLIEAMLVDLAEEQAALRRAANPLSDEVFKERLSYLDRLRQHPFIQVPPARSPQWTALITLVAGLTSLAKEPLWWWQLFGRQRAVSGHILDVTRWLRSELFEKQAIDAQGDTTATLDQIDAAIHAVCATNHALVARVRAGFPSGSASSSTATPPSPASSTPQATRSPARPSAGSTPSPASGTPTSLSAPSTTSSTASPSKPPCASTTPTPAPACSPPPPTMTPTPPKPTSPPNTRPKSTRSRSAPTPAALNATLTPNDPFIFTQHIDTKEIFAFSR